MDLVRLDLNKFGPQVEKKSALSTVDDNCTQHPSFEDILTQSLVKVNDLQQDADVMVQKLAVGDVDDVSTVVLSVQRAEMALRMITEGRNKLFDAYQQLARMPV